MHQSRYGMGQKRCTHCDIFMTGMIVLSMLQWNFENKTEEYCQKTAIDDYVECEANLKQTVS